MFISILIALALLLVLIIVVALQPDDFRISRKTIISAPAAEVFPHVNELRQWAVWSPWAKMDPEAKMTYEGPASGVGAIHAWVGPKTGAGRMTITESRPSELIRFRLDFLKPFQATHTAEFTFEPEGGQTTVTWSMIGKNNFMAKAFKLLVNCDKMVGSEFEKGLADLKRLSEAKPVV